MRRTAFVPFILAVFLIPAAIQAQTKIALVDLQEVIRTAPGAKEAQARFNEDMKGYQAQLTKEQNELKQMQDQLQRQQLTLSPEAKKNREQLIQAKQQEYQQRYQDLQQKASQRKQELVQPILAMVDSVIEQIRVEGHYSLILDAGAGDVLAADSTIDLTQEVVRRLKAGSAKPSSGTAGGQGDGGTGGSR